VSAIRNYGWLLAGAGVGLLIALFGLGESMSARLNTIIPLPWGAIGIGIVVFMAFTSLHFRLQLEGYELIPPTLLQGNPERPTPLTVLVS